MTAERPSPLPRIPLLAGAIVLADFGRTLGREQSGMRPAVVISSDDFQEALSQLTIVVPCTTTDRGWPNHVALSGDTGLTSTTYALTEQLRVIGLERVVRILGRVDEPTLTQICQWVRRWIHLGVA